MEIYIKYYCVFLSKGFWGFGVLGFWGLRQIHQELALRQDNQGQLETARHASARAQCTRNQTPFHSKQRLRLHSQ